MEQVMAADDHPKDFPSLRKHIALIRQGVIEVHDSVVLCVPELRATLLTRHFADGVKALASKVRANPQQYAGIRFSCWKNSQERDDAYLRISSLFKWGQLTLEEAQLLIAPGDVEFFIQEVLDVTREFPSHFSSVRMKIKTRSGAFRAAPLLLHRLADLNKISEEDFYLFLGYRPIPHDKHPDDYDTDEINIYDLSAEYLRMLTRVKHVLAFKKGSRSLEKTQADLNHPEFSYFVRDVALYSQVFADIFESIAMPIRDDKGEITPIALAACKELRSKTVRLSELRNFLGITDQEMRALLLEERELYQVGVFASFFSGEISYAEASHHIASNGSLAVFVKRASELRKAYPEDLPEGYIKMAMKEGAVSNLFIAVSEYHHKGIITDDEYELFLGSESDPDAYARLQMIETTRPHFSRISSFYSGSCEPEALLQSLQCSSLPEFVHRINASIPSLKAQGYPLSPLRLNGGDQYDKRSLMVLDALLQDEIEKEDACLFMSAEEAAIDEDLNKLQVLKAATEIILGFRKGDLNLQEALEHSETSSVPEFLKKGFQLVRLFDLAGDSYERYPFSPTMEEIPDGLMPFCAPVLEGLSDEVRVLLNWTSKQSNRFHFLARRQQQHQWISLMRRGQMSFPETQALFGHQQISTTVRTLADLITSDPKLGLLSAVPLREEGGRALPFVADILEALQSHEVYEGEVMTCLGCTQTELQKLQTELQGLQDLKVLHALKAQSCTISEAIRSLGLDSLPALSRHLGGILEELPYAHDGTYADLTDATGTPTPYCSAVLAAVEKGDLSDDEAAIFIGGTTRRVDNLRSAMLKHRRKTALLSWRKQRVNFAQMRQLFHPLGFEEMVTEACVIIASDKASFIPHKSDYIDSENQIREEAQQVARLVVSGRLSKHDFSLLFGTSKGETQEILSEVKIAQENTEKELDGNIGPVRARIQALIESSETRSPEDIQKEILAVHREAFVRWKEGMCSLQDLLKSYGTDDPQEIITAFAHASEYSDELGKTKPLCESTLESDLLSTHVAKAYLDEEISQSQAQAILGCETLRDLLAVVNRPLKKPSRKKKDRKPRTRTPKPRMYGPRQRKPSRNKLTRENIPEAMIDAIIDWRHHRIEESELLETLKVSSRDSANAKIRIIRRLFPERLADLPERRRSSFNAQDEDSIRVSLAYRKGEITLSAAMKQLGLNSKSTTSAHIRRVAENNPELFKDLPAKKGRKKTPDTYRPEDIEMARKWRLQVISTAAACQYFGLDAEHALWKKVGGIAKRHPEAFDGVPYRLKSDQEISQDEIMAVQDYKRGRISAAVARARLGARSKRRFNDRMTLITEQHPESFENIPSRAPKNTNFKPEHTAAAIAFLKGEIDVRTALDRLEILKISQLANRLYRVYHFDPEPFGDLQIPQPGGIIPHQEKKKPIPEEDIKKVRAYKKGHLTIQEVAKHFGYTNMSSTRGRVQKIVAECPERFSDIPESRKRKRAFTDQNEVEIEAAIAYRRGDISPAEAAEKLGVKNQDCVTAKVKKIQQRYPDRFTGVPTSRKRPAPPFSERTICAVIQYKQTQISPQKAMRALRVSSLSSLRDKVKKVCDRHPERFEHVSSIRAREISEIPEEHIETARMYLKSEISIEKASDILGVGVVYKKVREIIKRHPERFTDCPAERAKAQKETFSLEDFSLVTAYLSGLKSLEDLQKAFGHSNSGSTRHRIRAIRTRHPELFQNFENEPLDEQTSIEMAIKYRRAEISVEQALEYFRCEHESTIQKTIKQLQSKYPNQFTGVPKRRMKPKAPVQESILEAILQYKSGRLSFADAKDIVAPQLTKSSAHRKIREIIAAHPQIFSHLS